MDGGATSLWKSPEGKLTVFKMVIKTNTIALEIFNPLDSSAPIDYTHYGPFTVARAYLGGFNRLSMTMGNDLGSGGVASLVDNIELPAA